MRLIVSENKVLASICRQSFYQFFKHFWGTIVHEPLVLNWHIEYLCDELQAAAERVFAGQPKLYDLVINISPGSSKSTICSQLFPAWVWTRMGHAQLIHISYAFAIALKDSIACRDVVQSELYQSCFPEIQLREDVNTQGLFMTTDRGYRLSAGTLGSITGKHGHFLMVDDPLNPEEAFSDAELRNVNRWMQTTLPTRKVDKRTTVTILIQQRLHQADPSGEILERSHGTGVKHINLPGEVTDAISPKELRDKYVDGLFDPQRMPREVLDQLRMDIGEYAYAAQILQEPVPMGGGMFKVDKFNIVQDLASPIVRWVRSWDKAGTSKNQKGSGSAAWTVGVLMGMDKHGRVWVCDVIRERLGSFDREELIKKTAEEDGDDVEIVLEIEGGSGGKESAEGTVTRLHGYRIFTYSPGSDKETRAYQYSSQVTAGNVFLLDRHWTKPFVEEHRYFPNSKFKDQVDASSAGYNRLHKKKRRAGGIRALLAYKS
jgi:predicted phage terminase large subunit-like protein